MNHEINNRHTQKKSKVSATERNKPYSKIKVDLFVEQTNLELTFSYNSATDRYFLCHIATIKVLFFKERADRK